jgi:hypothetical protein
MMQTSRRRESGRQATAQFAPRPVSVQDGNSTECGQGELRQEAGVRATLVTAGLISGARSHSRRRELLLMAGSARANEARLLYGSPDSTRRAVAKGKPVIPKTKIAYAPDACSLLIH